MFRAIITSQLWRSEPLFLLSLGVQSCHHSSVSTFRVVITSWFRHSEPSVFSIWISGPLSLLSLGIQNHQHFPFGVPSHYHLSTLAFRATTSFQFGVQNYRPSSVRHSKSSCLYFVRHLETSPFFFILAFRAIFHTHSCILSHHSS